MRYSTPKLIDLSLQSVSGACASGSTNVDNCNSGSNAQSGCTNGDTNAEADGCKDGTTNSFFPGGCNAGSIN
jgi:hypothetical protein